MIGRRFHWFMMHAIYKGGLPQHFTCVHPASRVLTFGDSLTEGLVSQRTAFHPYAHKLQALLRLRLYPSAEVQTGV